MTPSVLSDVNKLLDIPGVSENIREMHRADILPYLFRMRGAPYSLRDYPQFREMYSTDYAPDTIFMCGRQIGKSLCTNDLCTLSNGKLIRLGDVHVGQHMLSVDDSHCLVSRSVTDKFDHDVQDVWRVRTRLGGRLECTKEHRLRTVFGYTPLGSLGVGSRIAAPRRGGIFTGTAEIPRERIILTAYMIGDGCCTNNITFSSGCDAVAEEFVAQAPDDACAAKDKRNKTHVIQARKSHPLWAWLPEDDLYGHYAHNKFIPDWVFDLSEEDTRLFISRLWATDGSVKCYKGFPSITYSTVSERLAYDLISLLHKCGLLVSVRCKIAQCNGKRCRDAYELRIEGPESQRLFLTVFDVPGKPSFDFDDVKPGSNRDTLPIDVYSLLKDIFSGSAHRRDGKSMRQYPGDLRIKPKYPLTREKVAQYIDYAKWADIDHDGLQRLQDMLDGDVIWDEIVSIEYAGKQQTYDLEIEDYHNYVAGNVVIHNSMNLSRSEVMDMLCSDHMQLLFVAPLQMQTQRYSTLYLEEAINSCGPALMLQTDAAAHMSDSKIVKSVHHQTFGNGAGIQLTYAKTSSDRARGIFADRIDFDEIQDQLVDNIPIISESLTASKLGVRRFTGTAKTTDNTIEHLWQESSQCEWVMKCSGCNHWNIPTMDGKVVEMIHGDGVHCVKCGKKLDVRKGQFVPAYRDRMDSFRGFHIPQIVVPAIVENPNNWNKVIRKVMRLPLPLILQEVLGISCSVGARLITQADINRQSVLPSMEELQKKLRDYVMTVGGVDWGIAEHDSFTVHTIIGIRPDGNIDVLWARRFVGFDPDETLSQIAKAHRFYNCKMLAADFGVGFDKNVMLERRFGLPVVQIQLVSQNRLLNYNPILGHHRWTVDKTTALEILFLSIRYGKIFFPPVEEFGIYSGDLLSPYEELRETGGLAKRYFMRNPNRPDDFAMALCFATMLAMRLCNTSIINMIPQDAFGAQNEETGPPDQTHIDPKDILAALNV